jgi:hypothetical protein
MSPGCLGGTRTTLVNRVSIRGSPRLFLDLIKRFQRLSITNKEGPLQIHEAVPLLSPTLWQVATHAPKGPRAHTMSPPLLGSKLVGRSIPQPAKIAKRRRVRFGPPDLIFRPLNPRKPYRYPSSSPELDHNILGCQNGVRWCPFVSHLGRLVSHLVSHHGRIVSHRGRLVSHFVSHRD